MGIRRRFPAPRTLAVMLLLCGLALPPARHSRPYTSPALDGPTLNVAPASGTAGSSVTLTGSGYVPGGYEGTIRWDGADRKTFPIPPGGAFSTGFKIPENADPGKHKITVCANCGGVEFEQSASVPFKVTASVTEEPPTAAPPTLAPRPPALPEPLSGCLALALDADARVIDFEDAEAGSLLDMTYTDEFDVRFRHSLRAVDPAVAPRSGVLAGKSFETEFGSSGDPIRMEFTEGVLGVGMYVGMEQAVETEGDVTARLEAFGYPAGGTEVGALGSGTVSFPAGTTPVEHCVSYRAPEGAVILHATLDYVDAAGHSIFEPRLIDDLTILPSALELPADLPPRVEITSPAEGEIFTGGELLLRARIVEDRSLRSTGWWLEGGRVPGGGALVAGPAGEPGEYLVAREFPVADTLQEGSANTFIVRADDASGLRGEDRVTVYYQPPPDLDLEIVGLEATQATQCLDRSGCTAVPLIADRPTLVRAYVRSAAGGSAPGVTGELCYWRSGETSSECIHRVEPLWPVDVEPVADPLTAHRGDLYRTLNFLLPQDAIDRRGRLYIQVRVNPGHSPEECCYENNDTRHSWIDVLPEKRLDVVFIPVRLLSGETADLDQRWRLAAWLLRAYPISSMHVWQLEGGRSMLMDPLVSATWRVWGANLWDVMLYQLWWVNAWHDDPVDALRYYGMVPFEAMGLTGGVGGVAKLPGYESGGVVPSHESIAGEAAVLAFGADGWTVSPWVVAGPTAAEEIAHNHGRRHASACMSAFNPDPDYPVANGFLDEWGTDVRLVSSCGAPGPTIVTEAGPVVEGSGTCNSFLYDPASTHDYMSYCDVLDRAWTSRYTYEAMIDAVGSVGAVPGGGARMAPAEPSASFLLGAGWLAGEQIELPRGFMRADAPPPDLALAQSGDYQARLLSSSGEVLAEQAFGPVGNSNQAPAETGFFALGLPWVDGAVAVAFEHGGREIARFDASAHAPQVRLVSPNGGQAWRDRGEKTIRWEANDADGDALTAVVQYSRDNGASWSAVDIEAQDGKTQVDLAQLSGSPQALVRVVVSDGFHTVVDASDATFSVEGKPPEVVVSSPHDGDTFAYGWPVLLEGFAHDLEDGDKLDPEGIGWRSSRDGELGGGPWLLVRSLTPGEHVITVAARDSQGKLGEAQVSIVILNPDGSLPTLRGVRSPELAWGIGLGAGVGALAGAAMMLAGVIGIYRNRRRRTRQGDVRRPSRSGRRRRLV